VKTLLAGGCREMGMVVGKHVSAPLTATGKNALERM